MAELDDNERDYLAAFGAEFSPTADATARALGSVRKRIEAGADVLVMEESPAPPPPSRAWVAYVAAAVAVAAVIAFLIGFDFASVLATTTPGNEQHEAVYRSVGSADSDGQAVHRVPNKATPKRGPVAAPPEPAPEVEPTEAQPEPADGDTKPAVAPQRPKKKKPRTDATLHAELALLRPAQQALRAGNHARALKLFNDHRASFPNSALGEERSLGRIEAMCALGRTSQAKRAIATFKRRYPGSPLGTRVKRVCPAEGTP